MDNLPDRLVAKSPDNEAMLQVTLEDLNKRLSPADFMRETFLKWYPNATLETIANAGHYPMYETPVLLATMMESYMGKHL